MAQILLRITQTEGLLCSFLLKMMDAHRYPTCVPPRQPQLADRQREGDRDREEKNALAHQSSKEQQAADKKSWGLLLLVNLIIYLQRYDVTCKYDVADRQTDTNVLAIRCHVSSSSSSAGRHTDGQTSKQRNTTSLPQSLPPPQQRESQRERASKTIPLIDGMGHSGKLLPRHTERESFVHTYTRTHDTQPTHKTQAGRKADMTSAGAVDRASGHIQTDEGSQ